MFCKLLTSNTTHRIIILVIILLTVISPVYAQEDVEPEWVQIFDSDIRSMTNFIGESGSLYADIGGETLFKIDSNKGETVWFNDSTDIQSDLRNSKRFGQSKDYIYLYNGDGIVSVQKNSDGDTKYALPVFKGLSGMHFFDGTKQSVARQDFNGMTMFDASNGFTLGKTRNRRLRGAGQNLVFASTKDPLFLTAYDDENGDTEWNEEIGTVQFNGEIGEENFYFGIKESSSKSGFEDVVKVEKRSGDTSQILDGNSGDTFYEIVATDENNGNIYLIKENNGNDTEQLVALDINGNGISWRYTVDEFAIDHPVTVGNHVLVALEAESGADTLISVNANSNGVDTNWMFRPDVVEDYSIELDPSHSKVYLINNLSVGDIVVRIDHSNGDSMWAKSDPSSFEEVKWARDQVLFAMEENNDTKIISHHADSGDSEWVFHMSNLRNSDANEIFEDMSITFQCENQNPENCSGNEFNLGPRVYVKGSVGGDSILASVPSAVTNDPDGQFSLGDGSGCIVGSYTSNEFTITSLRKIRDWIIKSSFGRYLTNTYYSFNELLRK